MHPDIAWNYTNQRIAGWRRDAQRSAMAKQAKKTAPTKKAADRTTRAVRRHGWPRLARES
jgi:hypothetical protein